MGRPASHTFMRRGLTFDWMLVAMAVIALALLLGTMIRTGGRISGQGVDGGLVVLRETDRLIAFEDNTHPIPGLDAVRSGSIEGMGRVLGPFGAEAVSRELAVPDTTRDLSVSFDLYLWDQAEAPEITINGTPVTMVLRELGPPRPGGARRARASTRTEATADDVILTLTGGSGGQWAFDNLLVIAHLPADR